ncbi:MAG: outer membrane beta-barrel family protein, partial [Prevotellaceae bacterium]|nr:outer membrane beta-barrel family protein [Prevotellaceae bacterium]
GEVVVRGSRPVVSNNQGNLTVDVANSYLKDDISLSSILGKLPGIIVKDGEISMFSKEKLLIYINNMETRSQEELKSLQPVDIDRIEIIRNVGSEYDADIDAVIKIRTKKRRDESFFISLKDNLDINYYLYNSTYLSLYFGYNEKFSHNIVLSNDFGKYRDNHKSYLYTYFDDYTNSNLRNDYDVNKSGSNELFYSFNCSISKDKELGVQYSGSFPGFSEDITQVNGTRFYDDETSNRTVNLNSVEKNKSNQSVINLNYKQKINNTGEFSLIADYVIKNIKETTDIKESSIDWNANNIIAANNNGRVFSITPAYKINSKKFQYTTGLKYSYLNSKSVTEFHPSTNIDHTQLSEHTTGVYMTFGADLSFINIKSGIRMEYTNSNIQSEDELNNFSKDYFNLIPHISLNSDLNENLNLTTYYRQTLRRPFIRSLRSTIIYRDSLSYLTGNPRLKPAMTDIFGLNVDFYKFSFLFEYRIKKNRISFDYIPDSSNPNKTISTYTNLKEKYNELSFEISYSFNHPVFTNMVSINYKKQLNLALPFKNGIMKFNKPLYYFQTSGDVKILKNTSLDYSFFYRSVGDNDYMRYNKSCSNLTLTAVQYFMNRKLMISLSVEDIFYKNKGNRWTQYSNNNIAYTQDSLVPDSRYVVFSIRYNWGVNKSIQRKRSDTDHIGRL